MSCAVLLGGRFADVQEFCFQAAKRSDIDCVELESYLFVVFQHCIFRSRDVRIIAVPSCKMVDLLMLVNSSFRVRKVEICAVQSSKEVDLLIFRNRVLKLGNVHIWVAPLCYVVDLLNPKNRVFRLRTVQI